MAIEATSEPPLILVTGDPTVDWLLVVPTALVPGALQTSYQWETRATVEAAPAPGGAALLRALIEEATAHDAPRARVDGVSIPPGLLSNLSGGSVTRTIATWAPFPVVAGQSEAVWRLQQFLGQRPAVAVETWAHPWDDAGGRAVLVLDDANLGFRDHPETWRSLADGAFTPAQVVVKMFSPLARGPLWEALASRHADRLTLYCSVADLRKEFAPIGQPLSWERMGSEVVQAVAGRNDLSRAARVVVSLGLAGAVVVERGGRGTLVYDPLHQEGDWERQRPGLVTGLGTCVTSALALAAARSSDGPDWPAAVRAGLWAGRVLHLTGYLPPVDGVSGLRFPTERVAAALRDGPPAETFGTVPVQADEGWRIFTSVDFGGYSITATAIALEGERGAARGLPVERIGAWSSLDRTEIESMRSVRNIIREYLSLARRARPLNLAVFGPPGSGKSFAIKQMAREWAAGPTKLAILEFNVSQIGDPAELPSALQRVRDCAVEESLPLVFWDEFDSAPAGQELGWLARFLAPMQDGTFVEDGVVRPIGPAIFVFAGGTHPTMASFKARAVELPGAKATDFLSRLRGFVDILGPNPAGEDDQTFGLRRAILLRALVRARAPRLFSGARLNIDPGVLRAFLDVRDYVHGARSMEAIVEMSALAGRLRFERSALPARHQLSLHVDAGAFLDLVHQTDGA